MDFLFFHDHAETTFLHTQSSNFQLVFADHVLSLIFLCDRLLDVIHNEKDLCLIFEHLDMDLRMYMDVVPEFSKDKDRIKVRPLT